ncbi:MAG: homocysteine S-methyltransferase family protein, partial [Clostridia bacterium]|nr:homocysteine S-methyltransferase family protein [Clostridia bacterium]
MKIKDLLNKKRLYIDGGMGTLLQKRGLSAGELPELWNLTHADDITDIHLSYLKAGSNIITTNTFGANPIKFSNLKEIIPAAINNAKKAIELFDGNKEECFIAFDVGPLGRMLEPLGDMPFQKAVEIFSESIRMGAESGADLIIIETMTDSYETKAALLAAKESCDLPVFVTNAYDETGKLLTGASPKAMIALLEGLGADAIGINCSLGPHQMKGIAEEYLKYSSLPVIVSPNAGMPRTENGKTVFDVDAEEFSLVMREIAEMGAAVLGGCCGTTPDYIRATVEKTKNLPFSPAQNKNLTLVSSYTHAVEIGNDPILIGERINPTGKKRFKEALREGDINYIVNEGIAQQEKGVHILDVNVGLPEIDEDEMLVKSVKELQSVLDLPLQLDTAKKSSMEKAMRIYNGKPLVNSVNGKQEVMDEILPLVKKYGGVVIALTIDETGIPETAEGRKAIAEKILKECEKYGIDKKDIIVDPLAMAVSSDDNSAKITLDSVKLIKNELGLKTSLGVSNVSFGLPSRETLNAYFLSLAFMNGLDCAIMNPFSDAMMGSYRTYMALMGKDKSCAEYIDFFKDFAPIQAKSASIVKTEDTDENPLIRAIVKGLKEPSFTEAQKALQSAEPIEIINTQIVPALDKVGKLFEEKKMYLPQLLMSAEAASRAFDAVKSVMKDSGFKESKKIILATVKGDIHDIGKNIVKTLLENYGFTVIDLGKDVAPERVLEAAKKEKADIVGLSALMTTTTEAMAETVRLLNEELPQVKTVVGGAVLTKEFAEKIGATFYAKDAMETVRFA